MNKSTQVLILTLTSSLIAHISVYFDHQITKYILSFMGAISAIFGGWILFQMRKVFIQIYTTKDFVNDDNITYLKIPFSDFKKENPTINIEVKLEGDDEWHDYTAKPTIESNGDITIEVVRLVIEGSLKVTIR